MVKNDKFRVKFECGSEDGCEWFFYVAFMGDGVGFQIRLMKPNHNCMQSFVNSNATARWCATKYMDKFMLQPDWNFVSFDKQVRDYTLVDVGKHTYDRARAMKVINGDSKA